MSVIRRTNQPVTFSAFDFPLSFSAVSYNCCRVPESIGKGNIRRTLVQKQFVMRCAIGGVVRRYPS